MYTPHTNTKQIKKLQIEISVEWDDAPHSAQHSTQQHYILHIYIENK